ncbi:MAG: hypothetical protein CHACPFDD_00860 [Phycisphaerae bacterium]|nr:hypothetical protein [Phycisphaerae bacterium]
MGVDLLAKYYGEDSKESLDPADAGPCFRIGSKPAKYVFFRLDSKLAAFGYFALLSLQYDPGVGLVLYFGKTTVTIQGRNLKPLCQLFMEHLVRDCLVGDEHQGVPPKAPFVEQVVIDFE